MERPGWSACGDLAAAARDDQQAHLLDREATSAFGVRLARWLLADQRLAQGDLEAISVVLIMSPQSCPAPPPGLDQPARLRRR